MLCTNRAEDFGPLSHLYTHILTSCFLDTILIPLCSWLYLLTILILFFLPFHSSRNAKREYTQGASLGQKMMHPGSRKDPADVEVEEDALEAPARRKPSKFQLALRIVYYLLLLAQILMYVLEITRLSLAGLGIGLLPFTFVTLIVAGALRFTDGLQRRITGWRWANLVMWAALAVTNGVKIVEETKEGVNTRMGTKYPESDEITDVAVMVGVYVALGVLEMVVRE